MSEADIRAERLKKLDILKKAGMDAYPAQSERTISNQDFLNKFPPVSTQGSLTEKIDTIAGRAMSIRGSGGITFCDIYDGTARLQVVFQKDVINDASHDRFGLFNDAADVGDFIQVTGSPYTTNKGQKSILASDWKMLAKSLLPIPKEHFGLKDEELKLRERYLDILLDPEVRSMFERRAKFWQAIRQFYLTRGFIEVETPVLESSPGGAEAKPFTTHHNALDIDVHLRISLELWLKRLLIAGFPKVFEIGRIFRNEGQSREHLQDYTQLESYEAYSSLKEGGDFVKELFRHVAKEVYGKYTFEIGEFTVDLADEWQLINFCDAIEERFGIDPLDCTEEEAIEAVHEAGIEVGEALNLPRAIDHLWKSIRKTIPGPAFLVGIPVYLEPLAKKFSSDPRTVERLQIIIAGSELGKGFSELNDPIDQRARFEEQQKMRDQGDVEAQRLDNDYVKAMEYGMPPAFGFGMSERVFAFLEDKPTHLAQLFPLLRPKSTE